MTKKNESSQSSTVTNSGYTTSEDATTIPAPQTPEVPEADKNTDDYGYVQEKDNTPETEIPAPPKASTEEEEIKEPETKLSGYSNEEEETPSEEDGKDKGEETPSEEDEKALKDIVANLPETYNQEKVLEFAKNNKLTKEQLEAYVELQSSAFKEHKEQMETAAKERKTAWINELKTDKEFSGEDGQQFDLSVKRAESVVDNHMPNLKKSLTDKGGMLPPYIMKDLNKIYKLINPTAPLVGGEPTPHEPEDGGNFLDEMYG